MYPVQKQIRIAVVAANDIEDMEFIIPIDVWRRAKFIVDVIVCEIKNSFNLNYSSLKVSANFNLKHTNFVQYDAIFLPGGPGHKNFLTPASQNKSEGESKLHLALKKFIDDSEKWIIAICASPISVLCILDDKRPKDIKFTAYNDPELIGDFKENWINKKVVIDKNFITAQSAGCSFDLAFSVIEKLTSLEYAKEIATKLQMEYHGYDSYKELK